ncbi:MAG: alanine racemase [Clostridia bacterium]|nr:alanine racemase [Clostridia bacterium]
MQRTVAKINLKAVEENARAFKSRTKKLCAVVKADAYGHGAAEAALALSGVADMFAVAIVEEAIELETAACGKEILILTPPTDDAEAAAIVEKGFSACVPDFQTAERLVNVAKRKKKIARVHLKINTGMNRYGGDRYALNEICKRFSSERYASVNGVFSHLYTEDLETCERQRKAFLAACNVVKTYYPNALRHLSATYGATLGERYAFDAIRVGLGLYGYLPNGLNAETFGLKKAMRVYAKVSAISEYKGGGAGYGVLTATTEKALQGKRLATLRFGYADGFLRKRENGTVGAEYAVNNLCMDACLRVNAEQLKRGDLVPVMTDASATAKATGTIPYEVLCAATRRAEMVYVYE